MAQERDILSYGAARVLVAPATVSDSDNQSGTQIDVGNAKRGILIISLTKGTTGLTGIGVYSDETTGFVEAVANRLSITQDTVNSTATVTVTTNEFDLAATGIYVFDVRNLQRFVNVEFDGDDADSIMSMVFIATDLHEAPYSAAQSAYSAG
jgi:hypothetical protein